MEITRLAKFSKCRRYRFVLQRIWNADKGMVMFIGLNPSTANEFKDDATIRRVMAMARLWGYGGVYMLNCFPFISPYPKDLNHFGNTEENNKWLVMTSTYCKEIIFCWGSFEVAKNRAVELQKLFPHAKALIINKEGSPRHPLYVPTNTTPIIFNHQTPITMATKKTGHISEDLMQGKSPGAPARKQTAKPAAKRATKPTAKKAAIKKS